MMDATGDNVQNETTPLVQIALSGGDWSPELQATGTWTTPRMIAYYLVILVLIPISFSTAEASQIQFFESTICRGYYKSHKLSVIGPDDGDTGRLCKDKAVQEAVVHVLSWQPIFNLVASLLATCYTPLMLRSRGRKFVLTLNLIGHLCSLLTKYIILYFEPSTVEWTWVSSGFLLLAGGGEWRQEILFMILGDATFQENNLEDTFTIFSFQQALAGVAAWGSMRLGSFLMTTYNIYVPLAIGLGVIVIIIVLVHFMDEASIQEDEDNNSSWYRKIKDRSLKTFDCLRISWSVNLLVLTYLVSSTFGQLTDGSVFQQYISKHFGKTIAKASELQADSTFMNATSLVLWVVLFGKLARSHLVEDRPWIASVARINFTSHMKDIYISRVAAMAQVAGFIVIGIWPLYPGMLTGLVFCALGQPFRTATRCTLMYMTHSPEKDTTTGLFSAITIMDMVGGAAVNFSLGKLFGLGLQHGGALLRLPFFYAALLLAIVAVVVLIVDVTPPPQQRPLESSDSSTLDGKSSATSTVHPGTPLE